MTSGSAQEGLFYRQTSRDVLISLSSASTAPPTVNGYFCFTLRTGIHLNLGKLLVQHQKTYGGLANLLQLVLVALFSIALNSLWVILIAPLLLMIPLCASCLSHKCPRPLICDYTHSKIYIFFMPESVLQRSPDSYFFCK